RFVLENPKFSDDGWNFLDESSADFQRRVEIHFLEYLATLENERLACLTSNLISRGTGVSEDEHLTVLNWRPFQIRRLRKKLLEYTASMNEQKSVMMKKRCLSWFPSKPKFEQHIRLAISYQMPTASLQKQSLSSLGQPSAVSKAVDEVLELIDLKKRLPNQTGGRKRGSKNRFSSRALAR